MTIKEWGKDFKSFIAELQIPRDDYKGIVEYIDEGASLLKEHELSEWLEDSDPGQEYGTTWACRKCMHSIHRPYIWNPYDSGYKYCPCCGAEMEVQFDD